MSKVCRSGRDADRSRPFGLGCGVRTALASAANTDIFFPEVAAIIERLPWFLKANRSVLLFFFGPEFLSGEFRLCP